MTYENWPVTNGISICHWSLANSHMSFSELNARHDRPLPWRGRRKHCGPGGGGVGVAPTDSCGTDISKAPCGETGGFIRSLRSECVHGRRHVYTRAIEDVRELGPNHQ